MFRGYRSDVEQVFLLVCTLRQGDEKVDSVVTTQGGLSLMSLGLN